MTHDRTTAAGPAPGPATDPPVAEAIGATKHFGATKALTDVSVRIRRGESHGLVGRNGAGKSTLVSLLTGLVAPDAGQIRFEGEPAPPIAAPGLWYARVACVYQRPTVVPALSVAENLFLNAAPLGGGGVVRWRELRRRAREELAAWNIDLDVDREAGTLTVEQRQLVEIVRALRRGSRFVILDEPTAQLDANEIARLFERIRELQAAGVAFLFISHHLDEIYELCETVTVLRNGRHVVTEAVGHMPKPDLVRAMIGDEREAATAQADAARTARTDGVAPVLQVRDLRVGDAVDGVSFTVREGECLGLAGHTSSGKSAVGDAVAGLVEADAGEVVVGSRALGGMSVDERIAVGVGYVPEDRHERGLVPFLGAEENLTMSVLDRLSAKLGVVRLGRRRERAEELIGALDVKVSSPDQLVSELSGGNQQKCVMGRALASEPRVLVLIKPTAGVDIASKEALYGIVRRTCAGGAGALVVSDEVDELGICDRVLVMHRGRITAEFGPERSDDELVAAMEGMTSHE
jgi:simple sugar transport system ATP-binding protein